MVYLTSKAVSPQSLVENNMDMPNLIYDHITKVCQCKYGALPHKQYTELTHFKLSYTTTKHKTTLYV